MSRAASPAQAPAALDTTLEALADPTRRLVVELLTERPRPAGELADAAGTSPSLMSRHLRVLREEGIVRDARDEEDARIRIYELQRERFLALRGWLDQIEAYWTEQLDSFAAEAGRRARRKKRSSRRRREKRS